jgi:hypothetical protein
LRIENASSFSILKGDSSLRQHGTFFFLLGIVRPTGEQYPTKILNPSSHTSQNIEHGVLKGSASPFSILHSQFSITGLTQSAILPAAERYFIFFCISFLRS